MAESDAAGSKLALGVDIGRTKIAAGIVDAAGQLLESVAIAAPPAADAVAVSNAVVRIAREMGAKYPDLAAVGVGTAELVEWPEGATLPAQGTGGKFPLRAVLEKATNLPVVVDSDANVASWAEARVGAAAGKRDIVLLTIGTGIGGGFIFDGKIYRGANGFAGEVGHLVVKPFGEPCVCGNCGCWEALASGTALGRNGKRAATMRPEGLLARLAGSPDQVSGEIVFKAALKGDPQALALFDELGFWLGIGIASIILLFDPEIIVIGGGLAKTGDLLLSSARLSAKHNIFVRGDRLSPIVQAKYLAEAGVVGAAILALDTYVID